MEHLTAVFRPRGASAIERLNTYHEAANEMELEVLLSNHGDWGAFYDSLDVGPALSRWPRGLRALMYINKKDYTQRFTLMWFLLANGVPPNVATALTLGTTKTHSRKAVEHVWSLVDLFEKDPARYETTVL